MLKIENNFQLNVLKWIFQTQLTEDIYKLLDKKLFDSAFLQIPLEGFLMYVEQYKSRPSKDNFLHFILNEVLITYELDGTLKGKILTTCNHVFEPLPVDVEILKSTVLKYIEQKEYTRILTESLSNLNKFDSSSVSLTLSSLQTLRNKLTINEEQPGYSLFKDADKYNLQEEFKVIPTRFKQLNKMTKAGGFYAPQLITFMGAPKIFKTGFLLNLALGFVKDGFNVFYADMENGVMPLLTRLKQQVLQASEKDVLNLTYEDKFKRIGNNVLKFSQADLHVKKFRGKVDTLETIETYIDNLILTEGFKPNVIIVDYMDLINANDRELRFKIQTNYTKMVTLNQKYNCPCFTVSTIGRQAIGKASVRNTDAGEDIAKIYNAHAVFSLVQTKEEYEAQIMRLEVIEQRAGSKSKSLFMPMHINYDTMSITELDATEFKDFRKEMDTGITTEDVLDE